jgi:uncharacterized membrane protein YqhA
MLHRVVASSRYIVIIVIIATFIASFTLMLYEALVVVDIVVGVIRGGTISPHAGKARAVVLIEAIDVFLIAIVGYIIGLGLYSLFIDDTLPLPRWLEVHDLDDLKNHLVSLVIAVLAVLFLREAVARAGDLDLLSLGAALALMIAALTFFLTMRRARKD